MQPEKYMAGGLQSGHTVNLTDVQYNLKNSTIMIYTTMIGRGSILNKWDKLEQILKKKCPELELRRNEHMSNHTSFHLGGSVALMALPKTMDEAMYAVDYAYRQHIKPFFGGSGSNLLIADGGYEGFVIKTNGLERLERWRGRFIKTDNSIIAGSGVSLSKVADFAAEQGLSGLEFAVGIPGTFGGAIAMNAGADGRKISQVLKKITYLTDTGDILMLSPEVCRFSYRHSIFLDMRKWMILHAEIVLTPAEPAEIKSKMQKLQILQKAKQPCHLPAVTGVFKCKSSTIGLEDDESQWTYATHLIDQCGLKGFHVGGAMVSKESAEFVVNVGGATCTDVLKLIQQVKEIVLAQTGVELEMGIEVLGE